MIYKGTVTDAGNNPIGYATVSVNIVGSDSMVTGVVTDEMGKFEIEINAEGPLEIIARHIGFEDKIYQVSEDNKGDLGRIILTESARDLEQVTVQGIGPVLERKVDRLIFNVENSIVASSGGDALDVLQKTPGIRISGDEVSIVGKSSVKVMIDDRLSPLSGKDLANYLRSLTSNDISRVEVITNPPAKYEAGGNSGLINIVLKKAKKDYIGGNIQSSYRQNTYPTGYLGGGFTYQKDKWSLFSNLNSRLGSIEANENSVIDHSTQVWEGVSKIRYFSKFVSGRAGIDYELDEKSTIGIQYLGSTNRPDNNEESSTYLFNASGGLDSLLRTLGNSDEKAFYHSLNGHFKTKFDTVGKSMSIDLDYFIHRNGSDRVNSTNVFLASGNYIENSTETFRNTSFQDIESFTSGIDFEWPTAFADVEFGSKLSFIKNNSEVGAFRFQENVYVLDTDLSNVFRYKENTQTIYGSVGKSLQKWDFKGGLRLEFTQTEGNSLTLLKTNKNDYYKLFPTAYATYTPNENHVWSINYGKRINRPDYADLNPFRWYPNPYSYTEGNPFLQPYFIDNLELSHLYRSNLNTSLYLMKLNNGSEQVTLIDPKTDIQATIRRNFLNEQMVGISQSFTFDRARWFESYLQYDLYYSRVTSMLPNTIDKQEGAGFYFSMDNTIYFNSEKTFLGELNFWYIAPGVSGVDRISKSCAVDLGVKAVLLEDQLHLGLVLSDIFKTDRRTIVSYVDGLRQEYRNYYDIRQLRLSAVYRFGNSNLKSKSKNFSNEDERDRAE
ncbi:TonB-dependent receptor [Echinicola pacifica]|uniref:TonB-dependent receptor n=1 Tax=Echinicola pacifica TaxID=346377 RepID=A0A918Q4L4_9BACT|nr:outer membrane beta-barrel family protein [Echinicola pacifica]GGZ30626.1 TonB-dependent receptor [Echinicola pacifica]